MTSEDERRARTRQRGRDYINSETGAVTAEALGALLEALEREQEANSDEARAAAQTAFLEAEAEFGRATGATDVRRRRMAVEALDLASGARVKAGEFERVFRECLDTIETLTSRNKLRRLLSRGFIDDQATFTDSVRLLVDKLFKNPKGLMGALDRVEKKSGVDARKGLDGSVRTVVGLGGGIFRRGRVRTGQEYLVYALETGSPKAQPRGGWLAREGRADRDREGGDNQGLVRAGRRPARRQLQEGAR